MFSEILTQLADWQALDTWIAVTGALAAMACAIPGNFLVLRRQSMMGDALSHAVLPGIVVAFLVSLWMRQAGWITPATYDATRHAAMFAGAMVLGVVSALLTEAVERLGRVESSAALGVVFTTLFALGLVLIRVAADQVDLDRDCVLYGAIETVALDTYGTTGIPRAAIVNFGVLLANLLLVVVFFKELRITAFDPGLATTLGIHATGMHYALMAVTAATLVGAFESVGSILVIAMLVAPPATAYLLTDRLGRMIAISLAVACLSAVLGHLLALTLPPVVFSRLGFAEKVAGGTAGMMAVAAGLLFTVAMFVAPRHGLVSKLLARTQLSLRILGEDLLGLLYRLEELPGEEAREAAFKFASQALGAGPAISWLAFRKLRWDGMVADGAQGMRLTEQGRVSAKELVRSHRLWESYLAKHFHLSGDHLHEPASRAEHYIGSELRAELSQELEQPDLDPHGRSIPGEKPSPG